jgi:hypothetical protein
MNTITSNQKVVPQNPTTLDKSAGGFGSFAVPATMIRRSDPTTRDSKAVTYGAWMTPQVCRR